MIKAIQISKLTKSYNNLKAVNKLNLEISKGEFFGFLGPNGAGKTTTINIIAGLCNKSSGTVKIFGKDLIKDYQKVRLLIGLVPQEFNFDQFIKLKEMLVFQAGYFNISKKEAEKRANELMKQLGIYDKQNSQIRQLSGGMKRRAIIARALIHKPKLLILDEPTAGVDVELRHDLWKFIKKINKQGVTIFLTTHYIEEAQQLCKRIAIINHGEIVTIEKTSTLLERLKGEELKVTFCKPLKLPTSLNNYSPKKIDTKTYSLNIQDNEYSKLLKILSKIGNIDKIETKEKKLEEVFLQLTK